MLYNKLLENLILPMGDLLLGQQFIKQLKRLRSEVRMGENEIERLQKKRLKDILTHAVTHSPYYRDLQIPLESDPELFLKKFPILDKRILHDQQFRMLTQPSGNLLRQSSSGSSGFQSVVFWTKEEQSVHRATQILWWEWAGYRLGMPIVQTGVTVTRGIVKRIKDALLRTYYFPAFVPQKSTFEKALKWAASKKRPFLGGYASSLYVLSKIKNELDLEVRFSGSVSWGDKLFRHYRESIDSSFDVNVNETYGSAEGLMIAAQKDLPHMYVMTPNVYIEILDDFGKEVPDGVMGNVVVTSLVAKAMPLIRYKIGDLAIKMPKTEYPKNRDLKLPILQQIIGRDTDIVKTRRGSHLVVHVFTGIFEHYPEIEQFCVIQENIDSILIEYIPRISFKIEILGTIKSNILVHLKDDSFGINFREVKFIQPSPSGKPQIIVSKLSSRVNS